MKKHLLMVLACLPLLVPPVHSELPDALQPHPRLLLFQGEEEQVRAGIASDGSLAKVHATILAESERLLSKPPSERKLEGRRLLTVSREVLRRVFFLSYAWRMTAEPRFLERAERELLAAAAFSDWHPEHFLDVAEMTAAVAIGYDWLYQGLSGSTRESLRRAIRTKGLDPSYDSRYNKWLGYNHNWNQVCNTGMTLGALAVYEDDPAFARGVIERAARSIRLPMAEYAPDGAYPEGYGYWGYGTTYNVVFLSAVEKALGTDFGLAADPGFQRTAGFLLNMTGPSGMPFNFSDSGTRGDLNPAMFWFASRFNDPSLLFTEKSYLSDGKKIVRERFLPALMVWGAAGRYQDIPRPAALLWTGQGRTPVAMLRSSWEPDAFYVAIKGGSASTNHSHMDIGSFVMDWAGLRWAMDFGMQEYNSLESKGVDLWNMKQNSQRWQVFRYSNSVHNTLTVDNALQSVKGNARITAVTDSPDFLSARTDLSEIYTDRLVYARRGIAIVNRKFVAVTDEVRANGSGALVRWTMLTPAVVTIRPDGSAVLKQKNRTLVVRVKEPAGIMLVTWSTAPPHDYDAQNPGTTLLGFEDRVPGDAERTYTVVIVPGDQESEAGGVPALADWR